MLAPFRGVVITGQGVVSPLGSGVPAFWDGLVAGRSAIAPLRGFPADDLVPRHAAEAGQMPRVDPDRAGAFALAAAAEALAAAHLEPRALDPTRVGVALGTTLGGMLLFERWEGAPTARLPERGRGWWSSSPSPGPAPGGPGSTPGS